MKALVFGGLTGIIFFLLILAMTGAVLGFVHGAGDGFENAEPPYTLGAALTYARQVVIRGGGPVGIVGLVIGSVIADFRQQRRLLKSQTTLPTPQPQRLCWLSIADIILGLIPSVLCGLVLVTELDRLEWLLLLGQTGWFTLGLLMVVMGFRGLCDKYMPCRTVLRLRYCCALGAALLVVWGWVDASQAPSDPSGTLKSMGYLTLVGSATLLLAYFLGTIVYMRRVIVAGGTCR